MITIKSEREIELMRVSGALVAKALDLLEQEIKPGMTTKELDTMAEEFIRDHQAVPSFLNYVPKSDPGVTPYPATLCISINEQSILVDCSHANSGKKHEQQLKVWENILRQKTDGNKSIAGVMIESNICGGNQPFPEDPDKLRYGVSITDECISWEETERMLREGAAVIHKLIK